MHYIETKVTFDHSDPELASDLIAGAPGAEILLAGPSGADRLVAGARVSFVVSMAVVAVSAGVGSVVGAGSAWVGGAVDQVVVRVMDVFLAFPGILLAIALAGVLGPGLDNVVLVSPSRDYVAKLPFGKLPDRGDFRRFERDLDSRLAYWKAAIAESERLGEAFLAFAERPDTAQLLPL